jgi:heme exporter protein B
MAVKAFFSLIQRDLKLALRMGGSGSLGLIFFLMVTTLIPFALGPDLNLLSRIGPSILWLAALLSTLLSLDRLFQADEEDGSLAVMRLSLLPMEAVVLAKCIAHWLTTGLPLALSAPLLGLLVALPPEAMIKITLTLLVGTPSFTFMGAVGAALTTTIRRGGLILAVLVIPFMIPALIFGVSAASVGLGANMSFLHPFLMLVAFTLTSITIGTFTSAAALKLQN